LSTFWLLGRPTDWRQRFLTTILAGW